MDAARDTTCLLRKIKEALSSFFEKAYDCWASTLKSTYSIPENKKPKTVTRVHSSKQQEKKLPTVDKGLLSKREDDSRYLDRLNKMNYSDKEFDSASQGMAPGQKDALREYLNTLSINVKALNISEQEKSNLEKGIRDLLFKAISVADVVYDEINLVLSGIENGILNVEQALQEFETRRSRAEEEMNAKL